MRLTFPDDGEEDRFVAGGAASGATPTEAARLTFTVPGYVESSRPEASANAPPSSTPRPRQIELGAASRLCQPPASTSLDQPRSTGRYIHWRAGHTGIVFHIGACAPPARFPRQQHRAGYGRPITGPVGCVCAAPPRTEHPPKGRGYPRRGPGCPRWPLISPSGGRGYNTRRDIPDFFLRKLGVYKEFG